jgi:hypothetical protein
LDGWAVNSFLVSSNATNQFRHNSPNSSLKKPNLKSLWTCQTHNSDFLSQTSWDMDVWTFYSDFLSFLDIWIWNWGFWGVRLRVYETFARFVCWFDHSQETDRLLRGVDRCKYSFISTSNWQISSFFPNLKIYNVSWREILFLSIANLTHRDLSRNAHCSNISEKCGDWIVFFISPLYPSIFTSKMQL